MKFDLPKLIFLAIIFFSISSCVSLNQRSMVSKNNSKLLTKDIIWGINGHPVTSKDYMKTSIDDQFLMLQQHQLNYYRFDVRLDLDGNVTWYKDEFEELFSKSIDYDIHLMPVILINLFFDDYTISEQEAYRRGKNQMLNFVKKYGHRIKVYNLGNEQDLRLIKPNKTGQLMSDYDLDKFEIVAAYFKGMIDGIKQVDPTAKTLINSSNNVYFGFYELLNEYQIDYDILGFHWYSYTYGSEKILRDALRTLSAQFDKPIWITEINRKHGSYRDFEQRTPHLINSYLEAISSIPKVQALFIYELIDQPSLRGTNKEFEQSEYGIFRWKNSTQLEPKAISNLLKMSIEENKNGYENYVNSIFLKIIGEEPSESELNYWVKKFNESNSIEYFINLFFLENQISPHQIQISKNDGADSIESAYFHFLNRAPTPKEKKIWERRMRKSKNSFELNRTLLMSEEFWEQSMKKGYQRNTQFILSELK